MLGAVGAYSWSGTVVHQTGSTVDILPSSTFEETLEDKKHSSLLGTHQSTVTMEISVLNKRNYEMIVLSAGHSSIAAATKSSLETDLSQ